MQSGVQAVKAEPIDVPRWRGLAGAAAMIRDPAAHLASLTEQHGDCFRYAFGGVAATLVISRPSLILHVLKTCEAAFTKSDIQTRYMQAFLGKGLLTLAGEEWRRQRRVIAAGFRADRLESLSEPLARLVVAGLEELATSAANDAPVAIDIDMMRLTFLAVARALLGADIDEAGVSRISEAILRIQGHLVRRIVLPWADSWFRLSGADERHQALRRAGDGVLAASIERRLAAGVPTGEGDMLDALLAVRDPETGEPMSREAVVAELMQLLVAGHETSSTVLAWTLWLLARHPEALMALHEECDAVLSGRIAGAGDVSRLPLTMATLKEAMRLYPPFWMIDRLAVSDSSCDGIDIPAGTRIALQVAIVHRRPDCWAEPAAFRPERFLGPERTNERSGAYVPFGTGPRTCVGNGYAWLQMLAILTGLVQRFDIAAVDDAVAPRALLILRPAGGIAMRLRRRA